MAALAAAPAAHAQLDPPQAAVGGANSKWISGTLLQQTGLNCSVAIIGNSYTEVMVSGIASYGGAPNGGIPKVGDPYWTAFLVSIPGNPCGSGSSSVVTTLILPPSTNIDTSRQIRCFGLGRTAGSQWTELTGGSWSFLGQSGPYCPTQASVSPYHQGGRQIGFRPLANGQMFWVFVPVKSTGTLIGAGGPSPGHGFTWMTDATGVYANPGRSFVWANVLGSSTPTNPFVYFSRDPVPFWKNDAPDVPGANPGDPPISTKNRVEFFTNVYTNFKPGDLCFQLYLGTAATGTPIANCSHANFTPGISNLYDLWYYAGTGDSLGPNEGYVPFAYTLPNTNYTMRWTFTPHDGSGMVFKDVTFKTLAGADQDGDGVPNNGADKCPSVKGTLSNGCLPAAIPDPDKDGVYGAADKCPATAGRGALNGCPGGIIPTPPNPVELVGSLTIKRNALIKKSALAKGAPIALECTVDSAARGTLTITKKVAKALRIKLKKRQKKVVIAKGSGRCDADSGGTLKLKVLRAHAKKLKRARKKFPAALAIGLTAPGQTPITLKQTVKFG